jgi:hypothetical protein
MIELFWFWIYFVVAVGLIFTVANVGTLIRLLREKRNTHEQPSPTHEWKSAELAEALRRAHTTFDQVETDAHSQDVLFEWWGEIQDRLTEMRAALEKHDAGLDALWVRPEFRQMLDGGLIEALGRQRQVDEDGTEVGVSREAVHYAVQILSALRAHLSTALTGAAKE